MHVGKAIRENPGYLKLRKIRAAQAIAHTVCWLAKNCWECGLIMLISADSAVSEPCVPDG